jgi:uncharacterized protein YjiS (DUF1127 family)
MASGNNEIIGNPTSLATDPSHARIAPVSILHRCGAVLLTWMDRARQRRALGELDARLLADIGVTQTAAERERAKPFWVSAGQGDARQILPRTRAAAAAPLPMGGR